MIIRDIRGYLYSISGAISSYIHLYSTNAELVKKLAEVETELYFNKNIVDLLNDYNHTIKINIKDSVPIIYSFIPAHVIDNSISNFENYIILNKGMKSGIQKDMGVISTHGIVGIISNVSNHFSEVIPLLNPYSKLSCMIKHNHFFGLLVWDGKDSKYSYLTELSSTVSFHKGDTVVTSGFSAIFPEGLHVGTIAQSKKKIFNGSAFIRVKLFTQFNRLHEVLVIKNNYQKEYDIFKK